MKIPDDVRERAKTLFFEGLIETEDEGSSHVLQKQRAMEHALGRMASDHPDLFYKMMSLGPLATMEQVSNSFFGNSRSKAKKKAENAPEDMTLEDLIRSMDSEVVSYHVPGERGNRHKFVQRFTVTEFEEVIKSYGKRIDGIVAQRHRYRVLLNKLYKAGVEGDVMIGDCASVLAS